MSAAALVLAAAASLMNAPDDWKKESFDFPLRFAPAIPYEGTEQVRFNPAWAKFDEDGGFSYVVLWDVKAAPVEPPDIEDHLETYFNGLMANVARGREIHEPTRRSTVAAHPMAALPGWQQAFGVEIRTFNAFSKGEPLLLYGEVTQRTCANGRMQIVFALSKSRRDRPIWNGLRSVRGATTCEAPRS
jgi:hypothetical protein